MYGRLILTFLISGLLSGILAQHRVGGILDGQTHWSPDSGSYLVESDILVPRFGTLEIDPGTRVEIASGKGRPTRIPQLDEIDSGSISIKVEGTLLCSGTGTRRVTFTPSAFTENCGWYGIVFRKSGAGSSSISHTEITGAFNGITIRECRPSVLNSIIERNNIGVNCLQGGSATISNCIIAGNFTTAIRVQKANPVIENCIIMHNRGYGFWGDGVWAAAVGCNCFWDNIDGNFQECDPALGKVLAMKSTNVPADTFGNLFCDPVFAGTEADSVTCFRVRSTPPKPKKIFGFKVPGLPRFFQPAPAEIVFDRDAAAKLPRYTLSRYSPCIGAGISTAGSSGDIGILR